MTKKPVSKQSSQTEKQNDIAPIVKSGIFGSNGATVKNSQGDVLFVVSEFAMSGPVSLDYQLLTTAAYSGETEYIANPFDLAIVQNRLRKNIGAQALIMANPENKRSENM